MRERCGRERERERERDSQSTFKGNLSSMKWFFIFGFCAWHIRMDPSSSADGAKMSVLVDELPSGEWINLKNNRKGKGEKKEEEEEEEREKEDNNDHHIIILKREGKYE